MYNNHVPALSDPPKIYWTRMLPNISDRKTPLRGVYGRVLPQEHREMGSICHRNICWGVVLKLQLELWEALFKYMTVHPTILPKE